MTGSEIATETAGKSVSKRRLSHGLALAIGLLLGPSAPAAVDTIGSVTTFGGDPSDDGPIVPTTGDLLIPTTDVVLIGDLSELTVDGGSLLQAGGISTDLTNTGSVLTVTGAGTTIELLGTTTNRLDLSGAASGAILNGAVVRANDATGCAAGTCSVSVGSVSGANALLEVSGSGSRLDATSAIIIGTASVVGTPDADAIGRLIIDNGGVVNGDRSALAQGTFGSTTAVSRGFLEVRDPDSQFNVNDLILGNSFAPRDAGVSVVTVEDAGAVNVASVLLAGAGEDTDTTVTVQSGGRVNALRMYTSRGVGSTSALTFTGTGSGGSFGDELVIGQGSTGSFNLLDGASVTIGGGPEAAFLGSGLFIGAQGGTGTGLIDDAQLRIGPNTDLPEVRLSIGVNSTGTLTVQNGAEVVVEDLTGGLGIVGDGVTVGQGGGANDGDGTLIVQGAGTSLTIESIDLAGLIIGVSTDGLAATTGTVDVLDGASVSIAGTGLNSGINVGRGGNSTGTLNVSGSGTTLDVRGPQGIIAIASNFGGEPGSSDALMTVTDGAVVTLAGETPNQGFFSVGNGAGDGELQVATGGRIDIDGALRISVANAAGDTQSGLVSVLGTGVIDTTTIEIGNRGLLTGDGLVSASSLVVGSGGLVDLASLDAIGSVTLNGGTYQAGPGDFALGAAGNQDLTVLGGGRFNTPGNVQIGSVGATTALTVDGAGSRYEVGGSVSINDRVALRSGGLLQATGDVVVGSGGLLLGNGGNLSAPSVRINAGGTVAPGESPGTLSLTGDLLLAGGTLEFEIAGTGAGQFDVLDVDGNVDLVNGSVSVALLDGFSPGSQSFDVIQATGDIDVGPGVSFLSAGAGPDFLFSTRTDGGIDFATITFTARDIATVGSLSAKQLRMASYLDDLCPRIEATAGSTPSLLDLDARCGNLRSGSTTDAQVAIAMDQLTPDEVIASLDTIQRYAPMQHVGLAHRLNGLRNGADRVDVSNLVLEGEAGRLDGNDLQRLLDELSRDKYSRWGFYSEGRVRFGERDASAAAPGFDFDTASFTLGTDYRLRDNLFLGLALGYHDVDSDFAVGGGTQLQTYSLSLLGTYFRGDAFYVDTLLTYGITDAQTERRIVYSDFAEDINRTARGDTDGDQLQAGIGSGFDFSRGRWVWGIHGGINYSDASLDGFAERGASGLNLRMPETATESLTANAGLHLSLTLTPSWGVVVPYAQLDMIHERRRDGTDARVRFAQDVFANDATNPTRPVNVTSGRVDANYLSWAAGVHFQLIRGVAGFVDYRGNSGLDGLDLHELAAGVRFERRL